MHGNMNVKFHRQSVCHSSDTRDIKSTNGINYEITVRLYPGNSGHFSFHVTLISVPYMKVWGTRWRSWLRHCATSWKVAGSTPDGVIGIFH